MTVLKGIIIMCCVFLLFFRTPMQALISIPSMTVSKIVRYWLVVYFSLFNYVIHDTFTLCRACKSGTEIPSHRSEKLNDPVCSLSIKGPVGDLYQLELPGSQFEGIEIKRKIYELTGIPISMQTLSSGSKCIHNTSVLMCRRGTIEVSAPHGVSFYCPFDEFLPK